MKGINTVLHHNIMYLFHCERDSLIHFVAVRNFFSYERAIRSKKGNDFTWEEMRDIRITKRTLNMYVEYTQRKKARWKFRINLSETYSLQALFSERGFDLLLISMEISHIWVFKASMLVEFLDDTLSHWGPTSATTRLRSRTLIMTERG